MFSCSPGNGLTDGSLFQAQHGYILPVPGYFGIIVTYQKETELIKMIREAILCKFGEVVLKGTNRGRFESQLTKEVKRRVELIGNFGVRNNQSTIYVTPRDDKAVRDLDLMYDQLSKVFGFAGICRAAIAEKNMEDIRRVAREYLPAVMLNYRSFKCEAKRSDKSFPLSSPEISVDIGGEILEAIPRLHVDLNNPDVIVRIEIRDDYAYIHAGQDRGAGGMPTGSAGKGLLLLSGGIDSPVAGYMMMKRGMEVDCVHFDSFPYTSEAAREKVFELAKKLCEYCGKIKVHTVSLTHIQEESRDRCEEDYSTLLLRRFMMKLATRVAREQKCHVLVTGESLGQVASQTLQALCVTDDSAGIPVFRPLIGMDKEEIIRVSRKINTFDTSILPYDDCCTVFTPRHPKTQPELEKVLAQENILEIEELIEEAWKSRNTTVLEQEL